MSKSRGSELDLVPELEARLELPSPKADAGGGLSLERIREALARHHGSVTRASRELGLKNRDVLYRLMKKHGIKLEAG